MNCKEVENNLIFFIEGNLAENKLVDIETHLNNCDNCNKLSQKLKADLSLIENDKISEPNPFLYSRISERLQEDESKKNNVIRLKTKQFYIHAAAYAAVVVLAIFLGIGLGADFNRNSNIAIEDSEELTDYQVFANSYNLNQPSEYTYELELSEIE
ncbi:MAG: hypothetical protein ABFS35_07415 [Bacteroidota bacterium]